MNCDYVTEFRGVYRFLSNFWSVAIVLDGVEYPTVEHAFQAAKTLDVGQREVIRVQETPGQAKRCGRSVDLRLDWEDVKVEIMRELLKQKFSQEPLRSKLLETGDAVLIEGNHWGDTFWGMCRGEGSNCLGTLLMEIREELSQPGDS